ncbi:MarC family protein [Dyella sp. Tek66A03]|uniref:MarC family protein n=1 Tax=Dyella sp. Tek66A03 TaxID=3458298 RepID=UPI00403ED21A
MNLLSLLQSTSSNLENLYESRALLPLSTVFVLLFLTLGPPVKTPMIFFARTRQMDAGAQRQLAFKTIALATTCLLIGGFVGIALAKNWHVSSAMLRLCGGIVFFLVSLRAVLEPFEGGHPSGTQAVTNAPPPNAFQMAVPMIVTPYGLAGLIIMLSNSQSVDRLLSIVGLLLIIMIIHLLAMLFAGPLVRKIGPLPFLLFGVIVGILTVALSAEMILGGMVQLGLLSPTP